MSRYEELERDDIVEAMAEAADERAESIMTSAELDAHRLADYRATKVTVTSTPFAAALSRA